MFEEHLYFKIQDENATIWRYMDFAKFIYLIQYEELFFSPYHKLNDIYEGSLPKKNKQIKDDFFKTNPGVYDAYLNNLNKVRINCWSKSDYESAALWNLFCKDQKGIAIKSTIKKLKQSFINNEKSIFIGNIDYKDYENDIIDFFSEKNMQRYDSIEHFAKENVWIPSRIGEIVLALPNESIVHPGNLFVPFLTKRKSFEHENELRVLTFVVDEDDANEGLKLKIDIKQLIEEIYISPKSDKWFKELVIKNAEDFGLNSIVLSTELDSLPYR